MAMYDYGDYNDYASEAEADSEIQSNPNPRFRGWLYYYMFQIIFVIVAILIINFINLQNVNQIAKRYEVIAEKQTKTYEERIAWRDEVIKENQQNSQVWKTNSEVWKTNSEAWKANSETWKKQSQFWEENSKDGFKLRDDLIAHQANQLEKAMKVIEKQGANAELQQATIRGYKEELHKKDRQDLAEKLIKVLEDPKKMRDWVIDELWRVRISQFHRQEWMPPAQ